MSPRTALLAASLLLVSACALIAGVEEGILRPPGSGGAGGTGGTGGTGSSVGGDPAGGAGGEGGDVGNTGGGGSSGVGGMIEGMINIPSATFMMGCNDGVDDLCAGDENPYHAVTLSGYRIDQYEVRRSDYLECINASACNTPACDWDETGLPNHPVTCVTWQDAADYCAWAGKRLPTEAEWEYAARGSTERRYPWGNDDFDDIANPCSFANANLCRLDAEDVGSHPTGASPLGAFDVAGNVYEWVNDWYDAGYYAISPATDPQGPAAGGVRVMRGGGWNTNKANFRTSAREANTPTFNNNETGFRCAL